MLGLIMMVRVEKYDSSGNRLTVALPMAYLDQDSSIWLTLESFYFVLERSKKTSYQQLCPALARLPLPSPMTSPLCSPVSSPSFPRRLS